MRVIAGSARGVKLVAPRDPGTRPIADRVKETIFGILGARVIDAHVLDLYAGSGAIGVEALSRGAAHVTFVERSPDALRALRRNLEQTGLASRGEVVAADVTRFLGRPADASHDLAFLDPPYAERAILAPLRQLLPHLRIGATVVVKHFWRADLPQLDGLARTRDRRFGETGVTFLEWGGPTQQREM